MMRKVRRLAVALVPALLGMGPFRAAGHHAGALSHSGSILVAVTTYRGQSQSGEVLALHEGTAHTLLHRSDVAFYSLVPSPDGRHVAALGCCSPATAGVWAFRRDGTHVHRVVRLTPSPCGNQLVVGHLAWSPGGHRLAYTVYIPSDAIVGCPPEVRDSTGIWVTPYEHPRPRQVAFDMYAQTSPPLSWSPDGRTLAVTVGANVRALDVATGASRPLVRGASAGIYAPVTGALAYVTGGFGAAHTTRIWVAGAQGRRRHIIASTPLGLADSSLLWSPNGRSVAYVTDTGTFYRRGARTLAVAGAAAPHSRTLVVPRDGALDSPSWSPDGLSIAYAGTAPCTCRGTSPMGTGPAVLSVDVATGARHLLLGPLQIRAGYRAERDVASIAWAVR
ncbi:MAG: hypothetical protein NVSMB22_03570 [Chloroflexota bacterium]